MDSIPKVKDVKFLDDDQVLIDGKLKYLCDVMNDTDIPSLSFRGSRFVRVPEILNFKVISHGVRLQLSCLQLRGIGNWLCKMEGLKDLIEGRNGVVSYSAYLNLDTVAFTKNRRSR